MDSKTLTVMISDLNPLLKLQNPQSNLSLYFTPNSLEVWTNFLKTNLVKNLSGVSLDLSSILGDAEDTGDLSFPKLRQLIISTEHELGGNLTERLRRLGITPNSAQKLREIFIIDTNYSEEFHNSDYLKGLEDFCSLLEFEKFTSDAPQISLGFLKGSNINNLTLRVPNSDEFPSNLVNALKDRKLKTLNLNVSAPHHFITNYSKDPFGLLVDILQNSKTLESVTVSFHYKEPPTDQDLVKLLNALEEYKHPVKIILQGWTGTLGQVGQPISLLGQGAENWTKRIIEGPHGFFEIRCDQAQVLNYFPKKKTL